MVTIDTLSNPEAAMEIARNLPNSFNAAGLMHMEQDLKSHLAFGAYEDGKLVGFVSYLRLNPEALELSWLAVSPSEQAKGIGTRLVTETLERVKQEYKVCEVKTLSEIDPDPGYAKTRKFYRKLGFIPLETISPYPGWGENNPCQIFVKFL